MRSISTFLMAMVAGTLITMTFSGEAHARRKCPGNEEIKEQELEPNSFDLVAIEDFTRTHLHDMASEGEAAEPSQEDLEEATRKVSRFLAGVRGEAAVQKIMERGDANRDGKGSRRELDSFLKVIGLGNFVTRSYWVDGLLDYFGSGNPKVLTTNDVREMLRLMELY